MAEEIAVLGIKVTSKDVLRAITRLDKLERQSKQTVKANKKLKSSFGGLKTVIATLGVGLLTKKLISQINTYTALTNRLKLVTKDAKELAAVQEMLFKVAQDTRGGLEGTIDLYTRLARSTRDLGLDTQDLADVTTTINKAISISGSTATEASAALLQLGQGLASGALRGQELNSVLEQTPRLAQVMADGLGIGIGTLREWGAAGKLNAATVIKAIQSQSSVINKEFKQTEKTIAQAGVQISNTFLKTFGSVKGGGIVQSLDEFRSIISDPKVVAGLTRITQGLIDLAVASVSLTSKIGTASTALQELLEKGSSDNNFLIALMPGLKILTEFTKLDKVKTSFDLINDRIADTAKKIVIHENIVNATRGVSIERIKESERVLKLLNAQQEINMKLKSSTKALEDNITLKVAVKADVTAFDVMDQLRKDAEGGESIDPAIVKIDNSEYELKRLQDFEDQLTQLKISNLEGRALAVAEFEEEKRLLDEQVLNDEIEGIIEFNALKEELELNHKNELSKIDEAAAKDKLALTSKAFGQVSSLMYSENKKLFEIGKLAALAQGTISLYESVTTSFAAGSKMGGPYVGAAFAAAAGIMQLANLAKIAGTSFGGGGGAPASSSRSVPSTAPPQGQQSGVGGSESVVTREIRVVVEGDSPHSEGLRKLIENIQETMKDMGGNLQLVVS